MKPGFLSTLKQTVLLIKKYFKEFLLVSLFNTGLIVLLGLITHLIPLILSYLLGTIFTLFNNALITIVMVSRESNTPVSVLKIFQYIFIRLIPMLVTSFLYLLIILIVILLLVIPNFLLLMLRVIPATGIFAAVSIVIFFLLLFIVLVIVAALSQAVNFCLINGENPIKALKSSFHVTKGKRMQLLGLGLLFGIVLGGIYFGIGLTVSILRLPELLGSIVSTIFINIGIIINYVIWKTLQQPVQTQITSHSSWRKRIIIAGFIFILIIGAYFAYKVLFPSYKPDALCLPGGFCNLWNHPIRPSGPFNPSLFKK